MGLTALLPGIGMMLVAIAAVWYWRGASGAPFRWFWLGAGLWAVAVLAKVVIALFTNPLAIGLLRDRLSHWPFVLAGGLYLGIQSSVCEIGLTWLAGLRWKQIVLGLVALAGVVAALAGIPGTEIVRDEIQKAAATTPVYWLLGPVERVTAIICHAASRALVLLGTRYRRGGMIALGFLIFTLLDSAAGAAILSEKMGTMSMWWFELAFGVFAIASLPMLRWCWERYPEPGEHSNDAITEPSSAGPEL
jgi:hypothetical protein